MADLNEIRETNVRRLQNAFNEFIAKELRDYEGVTKTSMNKIEKWKIVRLVSIVFENHHSQYFRYDFVDDGYTVVGELKDEWCEPHMFMAAEIRHTFDSGRYYNCVHLFHVSKYRNNAEIERVDKAVWEREDMQMPGVAPSVPIEDSFEDALAVLL